MSAVATQRVRTVRRSNRSSSRLRLENKMVSNGKDESRESKNGKLKEKINQIKVSEQEKKPGSSEKHNDTRTRSGRYIQENNNDNKERSNDENEDNNSNNKDSSFQDIPIRLASETQVADFETLFCHHCDETLAGSRYAIKEDHPYCINCFESLFSSTCAVCDSLISVDSKELSFRGRHWHHSCFSCSMCNISLVEKPFLSCSDQVYCMGCGDAKFAIKCFSCSQAIISGMEVVARKGKQWHKDCFICTSCKSRPNNFILTDEDVYCTNCYKNSYSGKCFSCDKPIKSDGILYNNHPWHQDCFICTACKKPLLNIAFTWEINKPFCENCFRENSSKRCNACLKPITGLDGGRFVSIDNKSWHSSCFCCTSCSKSLVDECFLLEKMDILCLTCVEEKIQAETECDSLE